MHKGKRKLLYTVCIHESTHTVIKAALDEVETKYGEAGKLAKNTYMEH